MKTATYTGPSVIQPLTRLPVLVTGQRVLLVEEGDGVAAVRYDPSDPIHNGCSESTLTTIKGVPMRDLTPTTDEADREAIERLTHHPVERVWMAAQDLGNALGLWDE